MMKRQAPVMKRLPLGYHLAGLVLVAALPLIVVLVIIFNLLVSNERDNLRQGLLANAETLSNLVDKEIDIHAAVAVALAGSPSLLSGDLAAFWREARAALLQSNPEGWIVLTDPAGNSLINTLAPLGTVLPRHPEPRLVEQSFALGKAQVSDLLLSPYAQRQTVYVVVPVLRNGKPLYAVSVAVPPERFLALLGTGHTADEVVAVIDRQSKFVTRIPDHERRLGSLAAPGWRDAIAAASEGWVENISVEGNAILTGYTPTRFGWTVGVARVKSYLEKPVLRIFWITTVVTLGLVAFSLALAWWLATRANASMTALASAARRVGDGQEMSSVPVYFAEAQVIAGALEKASAELQSRGRQLAEINSDLESRVAARSAELVNEMNRRELAESALRQTQKMEAIGQLTGGIAHDFNNMLTVVIGNLDTVKRRLSSPNLPDVSVLGRPVESALQGARNAAKLTHRLLAFARAQPLAPDVIDLRALVAGMSDMLSRTVGETVAIETVSGAGLWTVLADPHQMESALLNLVVNARDAMPEGGRITIETSNSYLDEEYVARFGDVTVGQYAMLSVSDTGSGIAAETLGKVFEPFFTTKEAGRGTGLGLSMVHGFVKQSGGHIRIYSEPGQGTTVKIYLPRHNVVTAEVPLRPSEQPERTMVNAIPGEIILVVEDDEGVLDYTASVLDDLGYRLVTAKSGEEALQAIKTMDRVDLLFTDVVLGGTWNGRQLAEKIREDRPDLPVLFTTGYTRNAIVHHGKLDSGVHLLTKPYTSRELAEKIRRLLDKN